LRQAASFHQFVKNYLTGWRIHAYQARGLRRREAETWQIDVLAQEPALHACERQHLHPPEHMKGKAHATRRQGRQAAIPAFLKDISSPSAGPLRARHF
jgi:hypothetical protein